MESVIDQAIDSILTPPTSVKRPAPDSKPPSKRGPKKPRTTKGSPNKPNSSSSGKRSNAAFEKKKDSSSIFTFPLLTFFHLQTSLIGACTISRHVYEILQARDAKITSCFSIHDLQYVTLLCSYLRCAQVMNSTRTQIIFGLSLLKDAVHNILLPDTLCKYIEILGTVTISSGITVIPFFDTYSRMRDAPWFIDARHLISREDREYTELGEWPVNTRIILRVQQGLSRALKGVLELRTVKTELQGSEELLSSYVELDNGRIQPRSIQKVDVNVCTLGAALRFRDSDTNEHEHGLRLPSVQEAPAVEPDLFLTSWVLKQLKN